MAQSQLSWYTVCMEVIAMAVEQNNTVKKVALSIDETAAALGVSRPTVYNLLHKHGFPAFRVGGRTLVSVDGLRAWVAAQTAAGGEQCDAK